jgi:hypothetical protein
MNGKPAFPLSNSFSIAIAATLATLITIGVLTAVAILFQRDGKPLEQLAAAQRACMRHVYLSERESCMREWLATLPASNVASK